MRSSYCLAIALLAHGATCLSIAAAPQLRTPYTAASSSSTRHVRAPPPRAALPLADLPAVLLADAAQNAPPDFGEVFLAGISIAFAAVGATVFVGILVNGNYDNIEQSFFESQDDELRKEGDRASSSPSKQAAIDFFGDVNPTAAPASAPPPVQSSEPPREPADIA